MRPGIAKNQRYLAEARAGMIAAFPWLCHSRCWFSEAVHKGDQTILKSCVWRRMAFGEGAQTYKIYWIQPWEKRLWIVDSDGHHYGLDFSTAMSLGMTVHPDPLTARVWIENERAKTPGHREGVDPNPIPLTELNSY